MKLKLVLLMTVIWIGSVGDACLGGDIWNLPSEKMSSRAHSNLRIAQSSNYTAVTIQTSTATITQYVNQSGLIFAVKWRGLHSPDLRILLGDHFPEYLSEREEFMPQHGRQPLTVVTSNIVVHHFGHLRDMWGLAYQNNLVPSGVNPELLL